MNLREWTANLSLNYLICITGYYLGVVSVYHLIIYEISWWKIAIIDAVMFGKSVMYWVLSLRHCSCWGWRMSVLCIIAPGHKYLPKLSKISMNLIFWFGMRLYLENGWSMEYCLWGIVSCLVAVVSEIMTVWLTQIQWNLDMDEYAHPLFSVECNSSFMPPFQRRFNTCLYITSSIL